jgi:mono/diheme cytochrome c family protein
VLALLDRFSAWLAWVAALLVLVMLVVGPELVAEDKNNPSPSEAAGMRAYATGGGGKPDAKALFKSSCGSCHTLSKAGTSAQVGPSLDGQGLDAAGIERQIRDGGGAMPAFKGKLSDAQIKAVAAYVAGR